MKAYICKDQPKLNDDDTYAHDCQDFSFTERTYQAIVLAQDSNYTRHVTKEPEYHFEAGVYYVSVLPVVNLDQAMNLSFELFNAHLLRNGHSTAVRLAPDPTLSALGMVDETFVALDGIFKVDTMQTQLVYFDVGAVATELCVTYDYPLTYGRLRKDNSSCVLYAQNASSITGQLKSSMLYQYRRLFLNVRGSGSF